MPVQQPIYKIIMHIPPVIIIANKQLVIIVLIKDAAHQ